MRFSYDRWLLSGGAVFGGGTLVAFGWFVYTLPNKSPFWSWPGITGMAVLGVGAVMLLVGFFMPNDKESKAEPEPRNDAEVRRERIAYRVSGHGHARPVKPRIRNQDVAFDVRDEGKLDDTDSDIG